jgi:hypothetical protein
MTPFDYVNSIDKRQYLDDLSGYNAFIINKKLSLSLDTIMYANEMNINSHLDNKMQYDYLYYSIRPIKKRPFTKWLYDAKEDEDVDIIMEYFQYNAQKAKQLLSILKPEEIKIIRDKLMRGENDRID